MSEIKFTNERVEIFYKGKKVIAFGTTDPDVVFIPTIGKFVNKNESTEVEKSPNEKFLNDNGFDSDRWSRILVGVPNNSEECAEDFYIRLESLGNKHYVSANKKDKLIAWMKLTEELFL